MKRQGASPPVRGTPIITQRRACALPLQTHRRACALPLQTLCGQLSQPQQEEMMKGSYSLRLFGCIVVTAFCLAGSGCSGSKYDGLTKEEGQPVITLLDAEALG